MRNNQRKRMRKIIIYILAGVIALSLCACGQTGPSGNASQATSQEQPKQEQSVQPGNIVYPPDSYDSKDTAVIVKKDGEADTVTLFSTAALQRLRSGRRFRCHRRTCAVARYSSRPRSAQI